MKKIVLALAVAAFSLCVVSGCKAKQGAKPAETKEAKPAAPAPTK
ncbi:MAG: hypothetical protein N3A66_11585 [Planctomycetota bacterium]|nr:hypothetical protein [Planctomycetota bacterium]